MSDRKYRQRGLSGRAARDQRGRRGRSRPSRRRNARRAACCRTSAGPKTPNLMAAHEVFRCARCGNLLPLPVGQLDSCSKCGVDLHSCIQCVSFDTSARWECTENARIPARVAPKDERNSCALFSPRTTVERQTSTGRQQQPVGPDEQRAARRSTICSSSWHGCSALAVSDLHSALLPTPVIISCLSPRPIRTSCATAFDEMTSPVRLLFFTQTLDCETCVQTRQILDELPPLSDKITIEEVNFILDKEKAAQYGIDRVPALALRRPDEAERDDRGSDSWARRPATSSSRSSRRFCWSAGARTSLTPENRARVAGGRQADDDEGVHDPDVTALSAGGQPRTRNGVRESATSPRTRSKRRSSRSGTPLPCQRRTEDGGQRGD